MKRTRLIPATVATVLLGVSAVALAGPSVPTTQASSASAAASYTAASYPTYDQKGHVNGAGAWHVTDAGGNCCEVYVTATDSGRLLEYGGTWPYYSDDAGQTWSRIVPVTPLITGEGAIVAGPGGNVYGVGWDPYSGDHLQGLRYTAAAKKWEVAEAPLHSPFFDREWITYVKGPFSDGAGGTAPFLTLVRGGTGTKAVELIATDGVSYTTPTVAGEDVLVGPEERFFDIKVAKNPDADWWQPNPGTETLQLNAGGVLLLDNPSDALGSPAAWLNPSTLRWEAVHLAFTPTGTVRQDSRGWLTMATRRHNDIEIGVSPDGGRTWKSTTLTLPPDHPTIEGSGNFFDLKVNGKLGQAVVSTRADNKAGLGQDVVWRVDLRGAAPKLLKTYAVGKGDLSTTIGVGGSAGNRFDFPSVALLPDGSIAASFFDSTSDPAAPSPQLAILD